MFFEKWHTCGNDFVIFDNTKNANKNLLNKNMVHFLSNRKKGIGFDQLLEILPPRTKNAKLWMRTWNSDGSQAEICGNGTLAVGAWFKKKFKGHYFSLDTDAGIKKISIQNELIRTEMGQVFLIKRKIIKKFESIWDGYLVDFGNPHFVLKDQDKKITKSLNFPKFLKESFSKRNLEIFYEKKKMHILVDVWERGVGQTLACGSGACASALVYLEYFNQKKTESRVQVQMQGGTLFVTVDSEKNVILEGCPNFIFSGQLDLKAALKA